MKKLTYKDCIELKEAGFPQHLGIHDLSYIDRKEILQITPSNINENKHWVKIPKLEELAEACGREKPGINRHHNAEGKEFGGTVNYLFRMGYGDGWFASYEFHNHPLVDKYGLPIDGWGNSPIQAVKELYIALNKK